MLDCVWWAVLLSQREGATEDDSADMEGENGTRFEEYEWCGQKRVRATTLLEGGFRGKKLYIIFVIFKENWSKCVKVCVYVYSSCSSDEVRSGRPRTAFKESKENTFSWAIDPAHPLQRCVRPREMGRWPLGFPRRKNAIIAPNLNLLTWDLLHHIHTLILACTHTHLNTLFDVPRSLKDFQGNSSFQFISRFINNLLPLIIFTLWRKCLSYLHFWYLSQLFPVLSVEQMQFERALFSSFKIKIFPLTPNAARFIFRKGSYSPPSAVFCKLLRS